MKLSFDTKVLEELLQSMYRLPNRSVLHLQDEKSCRQFVELIVKCLEGVIQEGGDEGARKDSSADEEMKASDGFSVDLMKDPPKGLSSKELHGIRLALDMIKSSLDLHWFPEYGSAIVIHRGNLQAPGMMTIIILGLDKSTFFLHQNDNDDGYAHEADATDYKVLIAGTIEENRVPPFLNRFQQLLSKVKERDGDRRTAAGGRQGHQFTPTLVHALATQAVNCHCKEHARCKCLEVVPKGGFTDNGRHTGGEPRNTSFFLAKFVLKFSLVQCGFVNSSLFQKVMLWIHLSLLSNQVLHAEEAKEGAIGADAWKVRADLDVAYHILEVISIEGAQLFESSISIEFVFEKAKDFRRRIDKVVEDLALSEAKRFMLSDIDIDSLLRDPGSFRSPRIQIPAAGVPNEGLDMNKIEDRMKKNIGPNDLFEGTRTFDLAKLRTWLQSSHFKGKCDYTTVLLRLRTVENVFWTRALQGFDQGYLDSSNTEILLDVVNTYRNVFHYFEGTLDSGWLLMTELRSRELLVVWIAYCLAFAAVKHARNDVMSNMSVALTYADLKHLVLSDKLSLEVVTNVASFLDKNHESVNTELFSFRSTTATFRFAEHFAKGDPALRRTLDSEKNDANSRMDAHWTEVCRKQTEAKKLRSEITTLEGQLRNAENERFYAQSRYASRYELKECQSVVSSLESKLSSRRGSLKSVLESPTPVCQPLPRDDNMALQWLFFLHMPPMLRVLSTLSFMGQQMLVPRPWKVKCGGPDGVEMTDVLSTLLVSNGECLASYYNSYQSYQFYSPVEKRHSDRGNVALVSPRPVAEARPKHIGPTSVDNMCSREDGVWFPDSLSYNMEWTGGGLPFDYACVGQSFDPFRVPNNWVVSYFTEKLGPEASSLQWAMRLQDNSNVAERANRPLASQEIRPRWLSKPQFLSFCNMRAFPYKQLRNVLNALLERSIPLECICVQSLLKQTLFHVGRISVNEEIGNLRLGWKHDLFDNEFLSTGKAILQNFADEISESPSSYLAVLALGDIACFLSEWDCDTKDISRGLAKSAFSWADEFANQAEENVADAIGFRLRQRILLSVSFLCLIQGTLNDDDVKMALKCLAISKNLCVDDEADTKLRRELRAIERRCVSAIAHCIGGIRESVTRKLPSLTDVIGSVIASVPNGLKWRPRGSSSSSFVAEGSDGCVYAINVLTGTVLVNGLPPSSLPVDIREHELYRRSFGDRNFEVVSKNEVFETVRRVRGFLYSFSLSHDGRLCVFETPEVGDKLELLDGTANGIDVWARELPSRLKNMHSHWLCRRRNTILCREMLFYDREVDFIIQVWVDRGDGDCHVIPAHRRADNWKKTEESLTSFPRLFLHDSSLLTLFTKYEHPQFIHFIIFDDSESSKRLLDVSLPRHGLTFSYRDGKFGCVEISGSVLAGCQQLKGSLFGFERYLVIQKGVEQSGGCSTSIIVADGNVVCSRLDGRTSVVSSLICDEDCQWHKYDFHSRFQTLSAGTVSSRLQLAALQASTSFLSPDCDSLLTGFERAIELVRGSWAARILSNEEVECLSRLASVCKGRHSPLSLLCTELMQSSMSVSFLHESTTNDGLVSDRKEWLVCPEESAKYLNEMESGLLNHKNRLTPNEETRILGQRSSTPSYQARRSSSMDSSPIKKGIGKLMEEEVAKLCGSSKRRQGSLLEFPLKDCSTSSLEVDIVSELCDSWDAHQRLLTQPSNLRDDGLRSKIYLLQGSTSLSRVALENRIQGIINNSDAKHVTGADLKRVSRLHAPATTRDMMLIVLREDFLSELGAFLSEQDKLLLQEYVIEWLRLCVVEDKLARLIGMIDDGDGQGLLAELRVIRNWNPAEKPSWLAFEVEHCLQIWPEQASVAQHLISNSGDIVQLNMGMGKTRIIIPLLVLHWTFHCKDNSGIPRINVLPQLLSEAYDFFHQRLTASIFNVTLVSLPFSRDIQVTHEKIVSMQSLLELCRANSGFVIVAPEHRLSLELKIKELELGGEEGLAVRLRNLHALSWIDILDESDELLHHRFQLIYAIGSVQELPAGPHRWQAAQALLSMIHGNGEVNKWIECHQHFAVRSEATSKEAFRSLQIASQTSMAGLIPRFQCVLANAVLASPPHEMEWMKDHSRKESILAALVSEANPPECIEGLSEDQRSDVLALRGLLVGGILMHCLKKRHRVDYGVARPGKKKLSVPFRGADMPSLRSEFSHPDCAIVFTILAYYEDGLTEDEVVTSFSALFMLGRNVQREIYSQWYALSKDLVAAEDPDLCTKLDIVEKIDLANHVQLRQLVSFYRRNIRVIDFWLNACVFPDEMQYYPQRLSATSWNLAENPTHIVGFSGTNDNHRLLPVQVKQYFPDLKSVDPIWQSLGGTNGRMLETILNRTIRCVCLSDRDKVDGMIELLKSENAQAIIDAGALLAGLSNQELAWKMITAFDSNGICKFPGVIFFDNSSTNGQWMALEPSGRLLPKNRSPVQESEAFAIFDEPRCRGADLKLNKEAVALLTLGPRMCKDKLMQAAGRMRSLSRGQRLVVTGTEFLFDEIREVTSTYSQQLEVKAVLEWTLSNTVKANTEGLLPWADQGLSFCASKDKSELCVEDEKLSLEDHYGGVFHDVTIASAVENALKYHIGRAKKVSSIISSNEQSLMEAIVDQSQRYGNNMVRANGGMDEECERELELEREIEEEKEVEIPRMTPMKEVDWEKSLVLDASSPKSLANSIEIIALKDFVAAKIQPPVLSRFAWSESVYGTSNFFSSVANQSGTIPLTSYNHYLRLVDVFLLFPSREVLLVSEREADKLIHLFWKHADNTSLKVSIFHLSALRSALDGRVSDLGPNSLALGRRLSRKRLRSGASTRWEPPSDAIVATMQLFAGETTYHTASRQKALKDILRGYEASLGPAVADPQYIVDSRANSHLFQYSDLETACRDLASEEQQVIREKEERTSY